MRYFTLACDYDGTLAHDGRVARATAEALERLRQSGRIPILVTGRELDDLLQIFPEVGIFERVVAENGALLYRPATREEKVLGERPPEQFIRALRERGVAPISVGRSIVATWHPHENTVLEVIRDLGLELQVIFNKGAVMVLPSGVNKASGLSAVLSELSLSPHNAVGVGDAENDHAFLKLCECAVTVANALPMLKEQADWVTEADHGAGVVELIDRLLGSDLSELGVRLRRYQIPLGERADGSGIGLPPYGVNLLLAGSSQGGKTTLATGVIERLIERTYQLCIIDPEGDYALLEGAVALGDSDHAPNPDEVLELLADPTRSVAVNLLGVALDHRPEFFARLLPRLQEMRARTGHPHWIAVDEAHHLLPASWEPALLSIAQGTYGMMLITMQPEHVSPAGLEIVDAVIAIGESPEEIISGFCRAIGEPAPPLPAVKLATGEALLWSRREGGEPVWFRSLPPRGERRRHRRKYAEGEIPPDRSFFFRGPDDRLKLRAQNLVTFLQLADGVDDETWLYHLRRGDYSYWFREVIRDEELSDEAATVEKMNNLSAAESRARIRAAIEERYTSPP